MICSSFLNPSNLRLLCPLTVSLFRLYYRVVFREISIIAILRTTQGQYLSEYERKEIQDYSLIYFVGAKSKKKMATLDNSTNNHGYDDDRGDYLVVNHDHLAYRYEVIDTLGKGSFGQVLQCRDHCTGDSVAIKIIRNKKRFHHQALVEIKILDNLRKWVRGSPY
jgi:dual specificity tyrosine-phosphorylation-regulated kinase 2/3/4